MRPRLVLIAQLLCCALSVQNNFGQVNPSYIVSVGSDLVRVGLDGKPMGVVAAGAGARGLKWDSQGNIVAAAIGKLLSISPSGKVTTIASAPAGSQFLALDIDAADNIIVGDNAQHAVWRVSAAGQSVTRVGTYPVANPNELEDIGVAVVANGDYLIIHDNGLSAHFVRMTPSGQAAEIALGPTTPASASALVADGTGGYFFADYRMSAIYRVDPAARPGFNTTRVAQNGALCCNLVDLAYVPTTGEIVGVLNFANTAVKVSANRTTVTTLAQFSGTPNAILFDIGGLSGTAQTITTSPSGLQVTVDGQTSTAPVTVNWTPGTTHTIAAVDPQAGPGGQYVFQSWSDGGDTSHTVTAPSTSGTYTATYVSGASNLTITSLIPAATSAGGPAFTLTVNGTGFANGGNVQWNTSPLTTTFVSSTVLTAVVPANLIANAGVAAIKVVQGGASAGPVNFPVQAGVQLTLATQTTFALKRPGQAPMQVVNPVRLTGAIPRAPSSPTPITAGSNVTFEMVVSNNSPIDATQVTVSSNLTTGLVFQNCTTSTGGQCSANGQTVTANLGTVPAFQKVTITVNTTAASNVAVGTGLSASSQVSAAENNNADGSSNAPPLTVADQNTASFKLTRLVIPAGAGTLTSNPSAVDDIYLNGTQLLLSETAHQGWAFSAFGNDLSGASTSAATLTLSRDMIASASFIGAGMQFFTAAPCRIADTRNPKGPFGGPSLAGGAVRDFPIPLSACNIPASATAYSLNVTVVPHGVLQYLTLFPTGQPQPVVSALNSVDGRIKANSALAPAGTNGAISVFATNDTDLVLDIDGYFTPITAGGSGYAFYPLTPCRVSDTRNANGFLGGPFLAGGVARSLPVQSSSCSIPSNAAAYSLNLTVVPSGPLGYVTTWPTGQAQPFVSTLNSPTGTAVANAAIVPAGNSGAIVVYATDKTELVVDINGYFAARGRQGALSFYPLTPCRVVDTRLANGPLGGPALTGGSTRSFTVAGACSAPVANAYSLNATVVPGQYLGYLTLSPAGGAQAFVSALNSWDGLVTANAAIVPASTQGSVSAFATDTTQLILDINGYFAP